MQSSSTVARDRVQVIDPFVNVSVRVERELWTSVRREALDRSTTVQALVDESLRALLKKRKG